MINRPWLRSYEKCVPHSIEPPENPLSEFLVNTASDHPEYIATTLDDRDISYGELNERVNGFAHALHALGVGKGDRVALILPNSPTYVVGFYAIMKIGAIAVNINVMTHGEELTILLNDSGAIIVITLDLFLQNVLNVVRDTPVKQIIIHSVLGLEKKADLGNGIPAPLIFNDLVSASPKDELMVNCSTEDIAVLQYTGGTTGTPKAATLTHRNLVSNLMQVDRWATIPEPENGAVICIIPFFHVFGMTICLNLSIYKGFRLILVPRFDWSSVLSLIEMIKKYRPHSFPAVPSLWAALVSYPEAERRHLSSISVASSGGAPLPIWVQDHYEGITGRKIIEAYGLSEASSTTHMNPFQGDKIPGSIGLPLPATDARIVDIESGEKDLAVGEIGELVVRGPQVMARYWKNPAESAEALREGWLYTGDLARMDERGCFYIVDRKKDLVISQGFNVYPADIEKVLIRHPGVKDAAIIGVPHAIRGESILAFVVLEEGIETDKGELLAHCRQHLPAFKVPNAIEFKASLPKNPLGKVLKKALRAEVQGSSPLPRS